MKRPQSLQRAAYARLHAFAKSKGRRTAVEPLEERFALNAAPAAIAQDTVQPSDPPGVQTQFEGIPPGGNGVDWKTSQVLMPNVPSIIQPELANIGNVNSTPYGMPNFSFGPDTWVFGVQMAPSPEGRMMHRPENPGAGVTPPREEASPGAPYEAPGEDRRSSLLLESSLKLGAARSRLDVFASPESASLDDKAQTGDGITSDAAEELIVDKRSAIE